MAKKKLRDTEEKLKKSSNPSKLTSKENPNVNTTQKADPTRYGDWEKGGRCIDF